MTRIAGILTRPDQAAGFTLIEALISMVVTALLITLIGSFMVQNLQQSSSTTTQASLLNQSQTALNVMGADVRSSSFVELHNSVTDPSDPAPGYWASTPSQLVLAQPMQDNYGGEIVYPSTPTGLGGSQYVPPGDNYTTDKDDVVYFLQAGTLYRRLLTNPYGGLNNDIENGNVTSCPVTNANCCPPSELTGGSCPLDQDLLENVTSLTIKYLDASGNDVTATDPQDAHMLQIMVTAGKTVGNKLVSVSYTTNMVFRNEY